MPRRLLTRSIAWRKIPSCAAHSAAAGRKLVEAEFSSERVGRDIVDLYRRLLREPTGLLTPNRSAQSTR